jgi:KUP system potassium uptake protein
MITTIVIVAAFNNSTQLTNAYGFAVATVMFTTSVLISLQIRYVKHLPWIIGILFFLFFGSLDGKWVSITFCSDAERSRSFLGRVIKEGS